MLLFISPSTNYELGSNSALLRQQGPNNADLAARWPPKPSLAAHGHPATFLEHPFAVSDAMPHTPKACLCRPEGKDNEDRGIEDDSTPVLAENPTPSRSERVFC